MTQQRILLVDSDEFIKIFFRDTFWIHSNGHGGHYEVVVANDITTAEKILKDEVPLAIFIEPRVSFDAHGDGPANHRYCAEFIKRVKNDPRTAHVPVIAFSAHDNDILREEMTAAGADDFMVKGHQFGKELVGEVERHLVPA